MNNVSRNDFLFFQNEVFQDMKNLEKNINEKINSLITNMNSYKDTSDMNYKKFTEKISEMMGIIDSTDEKAKINTQLSSFQKQMDDISFLTKNRLNSFERQINDISFKYDKIFLDNLTVPCIVGVSCPFKNMAAYIDYSYKKIKELLTDKSKQNTEMKSYKERLEILIASFGTQIRGVQSKFGDYCKNCFKDYEKNSKERYDLFEEKISAMRIENGKYTYDLIKKTDDLKIDWEKLQKIKEEIFKRFDEEINKHSQTNNNLCKVFNSQRDEFKILKGRFTELSDFIKDVRFRNNITNLHTEVETKYEKKAKFKNMSKRINFRLKQKNDIDDDRALSSEDSNKNDNNNEDKFNKTYSNLHVNKINNKENEIGEKEVKENKKRDLTIHKPLILNNVHSTIKDYFNQNKEYKTLKHKNILSKFVNNKTKVKFLLSDKKGKENNDKNNESKDFSVEEEEDKKLNIAYENFRKSNRMFSNLKENKSNNNLRTDKFNINLDKINRVKSSTQIRLIKESPNFFTIDKSRNNRKNSGTNKIISFEDDIIDANNNKNKFKKSLYTDLISNNNFIQVENNDNIMLNDSSTRTLKIVSKYNKNNNNDNIPLLNSTKSIKFDNLYLDKNKYSNIGNKKDLRIDLPSPENIKPKELISSKSQNEIQSLSIQQIEIIVNSILNEKIKSDNLKSFSPKEKNKYYSNQNSINSDRNSNPDNTSKNLFVKNFSFSTNQNSKPSSPLDNYTNNLIEIKEINLNLNLLNQKIIKTNKRMIQIYQNIDIKINEMYKQMMKLFGDFTGKMFFKKYNKQNLFKFENSPKTIYTSSDFTIPITNPEESKNKTFQDNEKDKWNTKKKFYSPRESKIESFKSIVDKIEPYLIKKFKQSQ